MDGKPDTVPCVKTGEQLILRKVRLKWNVLRRAHRFGWIRTPKELVKEQKVFLGKETSQVANSVFDESRHEATDSYKRKTELEDDKDEEGAVYPRLVKRKRKIEDLVEDHECALPLSVSSLQDGSVHAEEHRKSSIIQIEAKDPDVVIIDPTQGRKCLENSDISYTATPANANNARCTTQTTTRKGEQCQNKRASVTEKQHISQQKGASPLTKEVKIVLKPVQVSSNALAAIHRKNQKKEVSLREDARVSREGAKNPCEKYDSNGMHVRRREKFVQFETLPNERHGTQHTPAGEMQSKDSKISGSVRKGIGEKDTLDAYLSKETDEELNAIKFHTVSGYVLLICKRANIFI